MFVCFKENKVLKCYEQLTQMTMVTPASIKHLKRCFNVRFYLKKIVEIVGNSKLSHFWVSWYIICKAAVICVLFLWVELNSSWAKKLASTVLKSPAATPVPKLVLQNLYGKSLYHITKPLLCILFDVSNGVPLR